MSDSFTEAVVFSDDEDYGAIPVSLVGATTEPDLLITPDPHNFGATYVGCNMPTRLHSLTSEQMIWSYTASVKLKPHLL